LRVVVYDYRDERNRGKTRKRLKGVAIHAQLSVFETNEDLKEILRKIEKEEGASIAIFRVKRNGKILRHGEIYEGSGNVI